MICTMPPLNTNTAAHLTIRAFRQPDTTDSHRRPRGASLQACECGWWSDRPDATVGDRRYSVASVSRAAATVASMSASVWAAEMKSASYWLHGRYTPRSIMPQKKAA